MKTLKQHLTENLVNEAYVCQYTPTDWEVCISNIKPEYVNYSQLAGLEDLMDYFDEDEVQSWIDDMIDLGVKDTEVNREILQDIAYWVHDNYNKELISWRDDTDEILDMINNMKRDKTMWGVSQEDYAVFMVPKKRLSGNGKMYGKLLASMGNSGDLEDIAAEYNEDF